VFIKIVIGDCLMVAFLIGLIVCVTSFLLNYWLIISAKEMLFSPMYVHLFFCP